MREPVVDFKQELDQIFEDRAVRMKARQNEENAHAQALSARRNAAITLINTTLEPVLRNFVSNIRDRGVDIDYSIDVVSAFPGASVTMHVASTDRSISWQASSLGIRFSDGIKFTAEVWGRAGKRTVPGLPTAGKPETADRQFFERALVRFAKAVLDASE